MVMNTIAILDQVRLTCLNRASQNLAKAAGTRADFRGQLDRFYSLLVQVLESGNNAWLDPLILDWASSLTQTDLEEKQTNLIQIIKEIMNVTVEVCKQNLSQQEALDLISELLPCFAYAFDKAAEYEMQVKIDYISAKLTDARQSVERLDRSKSDFIAIAAHELKTPLTLVDGYSAMLREALFPFEKGSSTGMLLDGINNGTNRLKVIVEDMIDVSLIDNDMMSLNFQPVWMNRLFGILKVELAEALDDRKLALKVVDFPGSSEMTFGDPERILQVFRNILTNAIKFTPDGGKIQISGRKLTGFIEVIITDTGIGIAPDKQQSIFEKFSELGNSALHSSGKTKFKGGGPGLGLHIAKGILEAHGGAIWVESPGYDEKKCPGSTFHVILPLNKEPPDDRAARLFASLVQFKPGETKIEPAEQPH